MIYFNTNYPLNIISIYYKIDYLYDWMFIDKK